MLAGAQYSAEDVIRYFEQANAAAATSDRRAAASGPAGERGIVIGDPSASTRGGVVVGNAPRPIVPSSIAPAGRQAVGGASGVVDPRGGASGGDAPLAIPMTGAKAGYAVPPVRQPSAQPDLRPAAQARQPAGAGYDMLVTFEVDSAVLTPQARENLDAFARALASPALSGLRFAVEGHTDATGSAAHNLELSERRAASVIAYLVDRGVAADRLTGEGYGETQPRAADPEHPDNRRVETRRLN